MELQQKQAEFEHQYQELFAYAYQYTVYRIPHKQNAEDVVAESILKAYREIGQYDPLKGNIRQWLTGILRFAVIDYWRAQRITLELNETLMLIDAAGKEDMEHTVDNTMLFDQVMETLSAEMKAIFALRYIDGLTYQEIAMLVNKQPEAVRKFFSRVHKQARIELQHQYV